ncbi:MAG: TlpA family protein disulfide reductase [Saprospiraceae bacterium]|jgi:thiol-disulfide isomerase/thioredoxin|nr:TlpA family protein disulfide reductase [Saprospiraceae bacterium]
MKGRILFSLFLIFFFSGLHAQSIKSYENFDDLAKDNFKNNDTTYVINFWATWCKPCVKELPFFEAFKQKVSDEKIKIILVSLDFKNQVESHLLPFLKKNKYTSETLVLTDKDYNTWLPLVDTDWEGSIPATILIGGSKKLFAEREFASEDDLSEFVFSFISSL